MAGSNLILRSASLGSARGDTKAGVAATGHRTGGRRRFRRWIDATEAWKARDVFAKRLAAREELTYAERFVDEIVGAQAERGSSSTGGARAPDGMVPGRVDVLDGDGKTPAAQGFITKKDGDYGLKPKRLVANLSAPSPPHR
jgi:hypothetical protein